MQIMQFVAVFFFTNLSCHILEKMVHQCLKIVLQFTFVRTQIIISQNLRFYLFMLVTVNQIQCAQFGYRNLTLHV